MKRYYYGDTIADFLKKDTITIQGFLLKYHKNKQLEELQKNAWEAQIDILKNQLIGLEGQIYFEYTIPRMGKRVDNIIIIDSKVFVVEFKVGSKSFDSISLDQVIDYTEDLRNFHEGSHNADLFPILISTRANPIPDFNTEIGKCNSHNLSQYIQFVIKNKKTKYLNVEQWENSIYKPTPTIIEAAQALYKGHNVQDISRSDSGAINLTRTSNCISKIIDSSKEKYQKSICFVTGVPGAGKTLAGLNIATIRKSKSKDEHAVFLSGNGPLVDVLRAALAKDEVKTAKENKIKLKTDDAKRKANSFIQNIHHFRDDNVGSLKAPIEKVVVFDEAQRAWNKHQAIKFMNSKGHKDFKMSEPEFLIDVMNRHSGWCTIICLIGGGQEINTGEAGIKEWVTAIKEKYSVWNLYYSSLITKDKDYLNDYELNSWLNKNGTPLNDLHLSVSLRSFRSEDLSNLIHQILNLDELNTKSLSNLLLQYPIVITRDLKKAKKWINKKAKGSERCGMLISSGARRLRAIGIDSENGIRSNSEKPKIISWFLNDKYDVRSSSFLEVPSTEFAVQGLELDWVCLAWGGNFFFDNDQWNYQKFVGSKWQTMKKEEDKRYLLNTYRVLLTRARQGMAIFIPEGSKNDFTRKTSFYDGTFNYLKSMGIPVI
ncbi:DUF2075 domain-containing protein [Flammeovirga pectinis]|uniref:DUF2075 domain-containing protein n=1 Tax=Flammeovirga pectinis TaxID=2494373 RepID=A0A3S9P937_9BACT|nr:DUF2075 domain-containing protein [Flammeovirga pectinis]AZQ64663.1 DUF2075 domain-containing protein [Flammeovirga pectinis]